MRDLYTVSHPAARPTRAYIVLRNRSLLLAVPSPFLTNSSVLLGQNSSDLFATSPAQQLAIFPQNI